MIIFIILVLIIFNFIIFNNFQFLSNKLNIFDKPDMSLKSHVLPVSVLGGSIIFVNFFFIFLFFFFFIPEFQINHYFMIFASLVYLLGLIDDIKNFNYKSKFLILILIFSLNLFFYEDLVLKEIKFNNSFLNFSLNNLSFIFTVFCILALINAVNLFDGINLQNALYFLWVNLFFYYISGGVLHLIILIPLFFFIILNFRDKCFLGDSGSLFFGYYISYYSIEYYNKSLFLADELILFMLIPGLDMLRLFLARLLNNANPFKGDRNHLHHILNRKLNVIKSNIISSFLVLIGLIFYYFLNFQLLICIIISVISYFFTIFYFSRNVKK